MKEVFSFEESSESRSVSSNRHVSPISTRSTLMIRSFLRVLITWPYRQCGPQ